MAVEGTRHFPPSFAMVLKTTRTAVYEQMLEAAGYTAEEWELALGDHQWALEDRTTMRNILDTMLYGIMDRNGIPRVEISANQIAAFGIIYVASCNWYAFARWYENAKTTESLLTDNDEGTPAAFEEKISAKKLIACMERYADGEWWKYGEELKAKLVPTAE